MKEKEIADRRNFLKDSMAGDAGLVVASRANLAPGAESGMKQEPALATACNAANDVDVFVAGSGLPKWWGKVGFGSMCSTFWRFFRHWMLEFSRQT